VEGSGFGTAPPLTGSTHTPGASLKNPAGQEVSAVVRTVVGDNGLGDEDAAAIVVRLLDGVAAKLSIARPIPAEQRKNATKTRGLKSPD